MFTRVTSKDFEGLTNPYTGEPMQVMLHTSAAGVKFTCPDTFSTADLADSPRELYERWDRVNGVSGLRSGQPIKCAYTGELLHVCKRFNKCGYMGGFDPHRFYTREEFLYYAWMRDGVSKYPAPTSGSSRVKAPSREGTVTEKQKEHADKSCASLDEDKIHMIEKSMAKFKGDLEGSHTVSMSTPGRRRNGK